MRLLLLMALALPTISLSQAQPQPDPGRCLRLATLVRMAGSSGDLAAPHHACQAYLSALRSRQSNTGQLLAAAVDALDRAGLTDEAVVRRMEAAGTAVKGVERFYVLADLAKNAFRAGHIDKAQAYARELLQLAPMYRDNWNYGNAIYYGYFILGRVALQQGNLKLAAQYLLDAASTPGSPQLNSFGPNVTLAKELLDAGQSGPVLQYFAQVRSFWKMDRGKLDEWTAAVRAGTPPDFAANLNY